MLESCIRQRPGTGVTDVAFHFDLLCPWAYQTSLWMRAARTERDLEVTWRFFSLEELNRSPGKKHPWERPWSYGWSLLRIAALLRRQTNGNDAVDRFYSVAGRMLHEEGHPVHTRQGVVAVVAELGLSPDVVDEALGDESTNEEVRTDHVRAVSLGVYGVPTLVIDREHVLFGPVVAPAPTGAAAGRLWDAVSTWTEFPHLYELQRPKSDTDRAHIEAVFRPYGLARAGDTVLTAAKRT
jgi:predicted DsbA family dithiol-disulfide isomerase